MRKYLLFISILFGTTVFAQKVKTVEAEYTYIGSKSESPDECERKALEFAKLKAIADAFGTVVSETNVTHINNSETRSSVDYMSIGGSDVRGEWIETIGEPKYVTDYKDGMPIATVKVKGKIREIVAAKVEFKARMLKNGREDKFQADEFHDNDDLFVSFQTPTAGHVAIYLVDADKQAFRILPYQAQESGSYQVRANKRYVFFSDKDADPQERSIVDHLYMTCERSSELNEIYVIFSPTEFYKAVDSQVKTGLPSQLGEKDFHDWLSKCRKHDTQMAVQSYPMTVKK